ncbi:hypothetical protein [Streptococcus thoraltensis]|uniref:hypothetical protein n=1 Tax=Streptococcus thoraltensis TaxID=55085 RepID=UPI000366E057|nr:hypothetical protein [Streptococcus thoraltensis]MDY4762195.1 hypothetical protein [Streptococcus thoraltensis]
MTKMTTIIISTIVLLSCSLVLFIYLWFNIASHSVYYAHHMPHAKGTNPELVMTIKYLDQIRIPKGKGLRVNLDGNNTLIKNDGYIVEYDYEFRDKRIITLRYSLDNTTTNSNEYSYSSRTGNFVFSSNTRKWDKKRETWEDNTSDKTQKDSNYLIHQVLSPIIKYQVKPKVNLQWLFNMIYQSQFDEMEQISSTELLEY